MVTLKNGITLLQKQLLAATRLAQGSPATLITDSKFYSWENTTINFLEQIFGTNHRNVEGFQSAAVPNNRVLTPTALSALYARDLEGRIDHLKAFIEELHMAIFLQEPNSPPHQRVRPHPQIRSLSSTVTIIPCYTSLQTHYGPLVSV
jgi:hypothetical protein